MDTQSKILDALGRLYRVQGRIETVGFNQQRVSEDISKTVEILKELVGQNTNPEPGSHSASGEDEGGF